MDAFINIFKKDPFVCMKINNMLDRYNRLTYDRKIEIVYDNLIQNIIPKELINIMSIMISDLDMELKMKIGTIEYLEKYKTHIIVSILRYKNSYNCKKIPIGL